MPDTARIRLNVFDGTRQPFSKKLLITIRDGRQIQEHRDYHQGPTMDFDVHYTNGLEDAYTVIAYAEKYVQAGFAPIHFSPSAESVIDLMLIPKKTKFNFSVATWSLLKKNHKALHSLLSAGELDEAKAAKRYEKFQNAYPRSLAAFLNIVTAARDVHLPVGTALEYLKELIWDDKSMAQDRFFAYANPALLSQVRQAAEQGEFAPEWGADINHPGATASYKQKQFGEANLQFSFHEHDTKKIGAVVCIKVETDIDYYKDPLAHLILEVIPNKVSKGKTDPRMVYVLRWIAGRHAGVPEFDPPYTIESI